MTTPNTDAENLNNQPPATPPQSVVPPPNSEGGGKGGEGSGEGERTRLTTRGRPEGVTPEIEAWLDKEANKRAKAARLQAETDTRNAIAEEEAEANRTAEEKLLAAKNKNRELESQLTEANLKLTKLTIAIDVGIPNPQTNWVRLVGEDEDALRADAETLKASFITPDPATPPITPSGRTGNHQSPPTRTEEAQVEETKVKARAQHPMYQSGL